MKRMRDSHQEGEMGDGERQGKVVQQRKRLWIFES